MDVSIIIVNYNTEGLILNCLDSIYKQTGGVNFEIVVVDNASPIPPKILRVDKRIKYVQSEINLGFGKANNLGAKYAEGTYLFLLNPDTLLINNAIKILYDYICARKDVGACGGNLYTESRMSNFSFSMLPTSIYREFVDSCVITRRYNKTFNYTNNCLEVAFSSGAALMIRKIIFDEIGGFCNKFFMYYEDDDICWEIAKKGYKIVNVPNAKIIHLDGKSFKFKKQRELLSLTGRKIFYKKNFGTVYYCISNLVFLLNNGVNLFFMLLKGKSERAEAIWFRMKNVMMV